MRKLQLDVEALHVDAFEVTSRDAVPRGTVAGRERLTGTGCTVSFNFSECYADTCGTGSCDTGNPCVYCRR